ncbi:MAG: hypothetical protein WC631_02200 [Candidatus Paceibacterota bacterium]|jgi:hypothetical protein
METKFQTSFIPKKPIVEEHQLAPRVSLFLLVSIIVFLVAVGLAGWIFLEKKVLIQKIDTDKQTIEANKSSFETGTIESMIRLDSRIKVANLLMSKHISMSPIFSFFEDRTLKNVRFRSFKISLTGGASGGDSLAKVDMNGQARDFKTVASQADEFGKIEYREIIKAPVFADLNLTQDGSVSFSFVTLIVPDFISYAKSVNLVNK